MNFKHSTSRIQALSDGVFAFASTLLVVNVGLNEDIVSFNEELPKFISFGVSFFVMMGIWYVHYNFFRRTKYIDNWIIAFNMILLFNILFYVFPIKSLIGSAIGGKPITIELFSQIFQLYSIGFAAIFGCISLMYYRAYKKDKEHPNKYQLLFFVRHFGIFVAVGLISFLMAKFEIGLRIGMPGFIYCVLGLLCWWHSVKFKKKYAI
jgi:uncharacterized membrane protein